MPDSRETNPPSAVNSVGDRNFAPQLGDADAVDKTTYVGDAHGADQQTAATTKSPVTAPVRSSGGFGVLGWVALGLAALAFGVYAIGLFR